LRERITSWYFRRLDASPYEVTAGATVTAMSTRITSRGYDYHPPDAHGIAKLVRNATPYPSPQVMGEDLEATVAAVQRAGVKLLLIDLRGGPQARNDATWEDASRPGRLLVESGFVRVALLVRTVAGQLQMQRLGKEDGSSLEVYRDMADALAWLRKG